MFIPKLFNDSGEKTNNVAIKTYTFIEQTQEIAVSLLI